MSKSKYNPPKILRQWSTRDAYRNLHELYVSDDKTVTLATGETAHGSGSTTVAWTEFHKGKLNDEVLTLFSEQVFNEVFRLVTLRIQMNSSDTYESVYVDDGPEYDVSWRKKNKLIELIKAKILSFFSKL